MPTYAIIQDGRPYRLKVEPPYDMPIVTFHVRGGEGVRDATPEDLQRIDLDAVPDEQDATPQHNVVRREHHTHSPLHRQFWPLKGPDGEAEEEAVDADESADAPEPEAEPDPEPQAEVTG
jgi:hypothetical protein